jgi:predicted nucleic acid-binding protein
LPKPLFAMTWSGACKVATDHHDLVIVDAGPLIHLDELACLDLLRDFSRVLVPDAVWREVEMHRPRALVPSGLALARIEPEAADPRVATLSLTFTLHRGEQEALALAAHYPDAIFLTDDTAARLAAQALAVRVHGTLGMIIRAMRRGQRSRDEVLNLLRAIPDRTTLHLKPALLHEVIAQIEAHDR